MIQRRPGKRKNVVLFSLSKASDFVKKASEKNSETSRVKLRYFLYLEIITFEQEYFSLKRFLKHKSLIESTQFGFLHTIKDKKKFYLNENIFFKIFVETSSFLINGQKLVHNRNP